MFGNGCRLHVSSADGSYQTVLKILSAATRTVFAAPVELTLLPALDRVGHRSVGRSPGGGSTCRRPGNRISRFKALRAETAKLRLRLPAKERLTELVAWHPTLGVNGKRNLEGIPPAGATELSLLPPAPQRIRVVDVDGKPIGGLELGVSCPHGGFGLDRR